jgi:hypothetical protein
MVAHIIVTLSLGFAALRLPPSVVVSRRMAPAMQMPNPLKDMGSKFMEGMGLGGDLGLSDSEKDAMEARLKTGDMSFDDFLKQVQVLAGVLLLAPLHRRRSPCLT